MSWQAVSWVLDYSKSRLAARLVLLSIANHANRDGENAWPSIPTIAHEAHISERQAQRALVELAAIGELVIYLQAGPGKRNVYRVVIGGDNLSPGVVTNQTVGGDKSGGAIRKNRPEPSKPLTPPTPLFQRGVLTKRDVRMVNKKLTQLMPGWIGMRDWEIDLRTDGICKQHGVDPDVFRKYMGWVRTERPFDEDLEQRMEAAQC